LTVIHLQISEINKLAANVLSASAGRSVFDNLLRRNNSAGRSFWIQFHRRHWWQPIKLKEKMLNLPGAEFLELYLDCLSDNGAEEKLVRLSLDVLVDAIEGSWRGRVVAKNSEADDSRFCSEITELEIIEDFRDLTHEAIHEHVCQSLLENVTLALKENCQKQSWKFC
jgi:hypothetical protein